MSRDGVGLLLRRFAESGGQVLVVDTEGRRLTYDDVRSIAEQLADGWRRDGLTAGDRVALLMTNGAEMICGYFACLFGGFVANPVNLELSAADVDYIVAAVAPRLILRDGLALPTPGRPAGDDAALARADSVSVVFFTSGTTGRPKGVMQSLNSMVGNVSAMNALLGIGPETRMYHVLPMAYMAGFLNTVLLTTMAGGTVVLGQRFTPQSAFDFWTPALHGKANTLWISPSIAAALVRLTRDKEKARENARGFTQILCATAPLHDAVRDGFRDTFGVPLQESYGTSELMLITAQSREDAAVRRDVGFPLPGFTVDFVDDGEGNAEIAVRSPYHYLGYLTVDGILDAETHGDGFMLTGDAGRFVDGRLQITGRLKELIIRGGINVSPVAIENALGRLPGASDVTVIGLPHPFWGESIVVCIEAGADADRVALTEAVRKRCRDRLSKASQPDRVEVVPAFPRTATGKVQRRVLQQELAD